MAPVAAATGSERPTGVGAAAHHAVFAVSLDGLPSAHLRALLDGLPVFERYGLMLAGGYAFRAHQILHRPSQDLDFATRDGTPLPEIAAYVRGSRAGMTTSPFVSSRTLPTMKFRMTYDRYTRHEADSF
jgi:hypothetical protein